MISTHGRHPASSCPKSHPNNITSLLWCLLCPQRSQYLTSESEVCIIGSSVKCKKKKISCLFVIFYLFIYFGGEGRRTRRRRRRGCWWEEDAIFGNPSEGSVLLDGGSAPSLSLKRREKTNKDTHTRAPHTSCWLGATHTHLQRLRERPQSLTNVGAGL